MSSMHRTTRLKIGEINRHLMCVLCGGYLIDATAIIECLHSFCRPCIVRYLETSKYCPICDVQVHKTRPYLNIRRDKTRQNLVYKLVPGLFQNEMKRRREFYAAHPTAGPSSSLNASEERGEVADDTFIYTEDEKISLCLQHCHRLPPYKNGVLFGALNNTEEMFKECDRRYLLCPAAFTVGLLKKFIRLKFELSQNFQIDLFHSDESLLDDYTLMDVAYIYAWRRVDPLKLYYIVQDGLQERAQLALPEPSIIPIADEKCKPVGKKRGRKKKSSSIQEDFVTSQQDERDDADEDKEESPEPISASVDRDAVDVMNPEKSVEKSSEETSEEQSEEGVPNKEKPEECDPVTRKSDAKIAVEVTDNTPLETVTLTPTVSVSCVEPEINIVKDNIVDVDSVSKAAPVNGVISNGAKVPAVTEKKNTVKNGEALVNGLKETPASVQTSKSVTSSSSKLSNGSLSDKKPTMSNGTKEPSTRNLDSIIAKVLDTRKSDINEMRQNSAKQAGGTQQGNSKPVMVNGLKNTKLSSNKNTPNVTVSNKLQKFGMVSSSKMVSTSCPATSSTTTLVSVTTSRPITVTTASAAPHGIVASSVGSSKNNSTLKHVKSSHASPNCVSKNSSGLVATATPSLVAKTSSPTTMTTVKQIPTTAPLTINTGSPAMSPKPSVSADKSSKPHVISPHKQLIKASGLKRLSPGGKRQEPGHHPEKRAKVTITVARNKNASGTHKHKKDSRNNKHRSDSQKSSAENAASPMVPQTLKIKPVSPPNSLPSLVSPGGQTLRIKPLTPPSSHTSPVSPGTQLKIKPLTPPSSQSSPGISNVQTLKIKPLTPPSSQPGAVSPGTQTLKIKPLTPPNSQAGPLSPTTIKIKPLTPPSSYVPNESSRSSSEKLPSPPGASTKQTFFITKTSEESEDPNKMTGVPKLKIGILTETVDVSNSSAPVKSKSSHKQRSKHKSGSPKEHREKSPKHRHSPQYYGDKSPQHYSGKSPQYYSDKKTASEASSTNNVESKSSNKNDANARHSESPVNSTVAPPENTPDTKTVEAASSNETSDSTSVSDMDVSHSDVDCKPTSSESHTSVSTSATAVTTESMSMQTTTSVTIPASEMSTDKPPTSKSATASVSETSTSVVPTTVTVSNAITSSIDAPSTESSQTDKKLAPLTNGDISQNNNVLKPDGEFIKPSTTSASVVNKTPSITTALESKTVGQVGHAKPATLSTLRSKLTSAALDSSAHITLASVLGCPPYKVGNPMAASLVKSAMNVQMPLDTDLKHREALAAAQRAIAMSSAHSLQSKMIGVPANNDQMKTQNDAIQNMKPPCSTIQGNNSNIAAALNQPRNGLMPSATGMPDPSVSADIKPDITNPLSPAASKQPALQTTPRQQKRDVVRRDIGTSTKGEEGPPSPSLRALQESAAQRRMQQGGKVLKINGIATDLIKPCKRPRVANGLDGAAMPAGTQRSPPLHARPAHSHNHASPLSAASPPGAHGQPSPGAQSQSQSPPGAHPCQPSPTGSLHSVSPQAAHGHHMSPSPHFFAQSPLSPVTSIGQHMAQSLPTHMGQPINTPMGYYIAVPQPSPQIPIANPSVGQQPNPLANGYDAPLDFTTKKSKTRESSANDNKPRDYSGDKSKPQYPAERTLLKVPNLLSLRT